MSSAIPAKFTEIIIEDPPVPALTSPHRTEVKFNVDPELGEMRMSSVHSRHFSIGENYAEFRHNVMLRPLPRPAHVGLAIMNCARGVVKFDNREWVEVVNGQTYLTFNPGVEEVHQFSPGRPMRSIFLDIDPDYFSKLLVETELNKLHECLINNEFVEIGSHICKPAFYNLISSMFNCPLEGSLGNLVLEGVLQQLLALQFAMIGDERPVKTSIKSRDREVIVALKVHLDATFNEDHSILDLSKKFGINQNKLKSLFREMYGLPVIGYLFDRKMEHARMLLLDQGMYVGEVASMVGYRNANHFATAFKRKFGIMPSQLKA